MWVLLVIPASFLASPGGLGTFVGYSSYVLSQPHARLPCCAERFTFTPVAAAANVVHVPASASSGFSKNSAAEPKSERRSQSPGGGAKVRAAQPKSERRSQSPSGAAKVQAKLLVGSAI